MTKTNNTLQDIASLLLEHSIDQREQLLFEELDRVTIYRSNCWEILAEIQPTDFACNMSGGWHKTPEHLVWSLLHDRFITDYGILLTE